MAATYGNIAAGGSLGNLLGLASGEAGLADCADVAEQFVEEAALAALAVALAAVAVVIVVVAAFAARAVTLFGLFPLMTSMGLGEPVPISHRLVVLWGGMRGAVSLALALAVTENALLSPDVRQFIAILATGFVLFTLFVLVLVGGRDSAVNLALRPALKRIGARPNWTEIALPEGGHCANLDATDAWRAALLAFWRGAATPQKGGAGRR